MIVICADKLKKKKKRKNSSFKKFLRNYFKVQLIEGAEIATWFFSFGMQIKFWKRITAKPTMSLLKLQKMLNCIRPIQVLRFHIEHGCFLRSVLHSTSGPGNM